MAEMGSGPMGLLAGSLVMFRVVLLKHRCHSISMLRSIGGTWLWLMWHGWWFWFQSNEPGFLQMMITYDTDDDNDA
jgi:hypothetical protein